MAYSTLCVCVLILCVPCWATDTTHQCGDELSGACEEDKAELLQYQVKIDSNASAKVNKALQKVVGQDEEVLEEYQDDQEEDVRENATNAESEMEAEGWGGRRRQWATRRRTPVVNLTKNHRNDGQSFKFLRFDPVALRGGGDSTTVQLAELTFFSGWHSITKSGGVRRATNPGGNSPNNERPDKAFDDKQNTKWLDFNKKTLDIELYDATGITMYTFTTANDHEERDPISWKLSGSNDGEGWILLDEKTNYETPTTRLARTEYFSC